MPFYTYQVLDGSGQLHSGKIEADGESAAVGRLRRLGYTALEVREIKESPLKGLFKIKKSVGLGDLSLFSRQLAAMLNAGIPLIRTLHALADQAPNPTLRAALAEIASSVESGVSFSESLRAYPDIFTSMYVDMVRAGEVGGNLVDVLGRLSDQMDKDKSLRDNIKSATFYPLVVIAFAVVIMVAMLLFIVPVFTGMFPADAQLPLPTRIIVGLSESFQSYWYIYLLTVVGIVLAVRLYLASESGARAWDNLKFKLPVFGPIFHKTTLARLSRTLSTLLSGGIPMLQALETSGPTSGSIRMTEVMQDAAARIQEGQSLSEPLRKSDLFPPMVTIMVSVGEETGELSSLLNRVAEFYEDEVATITKGLTSLIEPILLIFVGGMVGAMVIALYLPMFTVITQIGG